MSSNVIRASDANARILGAAVLVADQIEGTEEAL